MTRRLNRIVSIAVFLSLTPLMSFSSSLAHENPAQETTLEPIFVNAQRAPIAFLNAEQTPGHVSVITSAMIRESQATSLPSLLEQQSGITTSDSKGFGFGADATVNMRGVNNSSRSNLLLLIDGVPQNRITGDEIHWQLLPLNSIEKIEILRGGSGILYGEGALAGVISITTKKGTGKKCEVESELSTGSFGYRMYTTQIRGSSEKLSYSTGVLRNDISGYRESSSARTTTVNSHVGYTLHPKISIDTQLLHSEDTSRFSGGLSPEQSQYRRRQEGSFPGFFDDRTTQASVQVLLGDWFGITNNVLGYWHERSSDSVTAYGRFATITPTIGLNWSLSHQRDMGDTGKHTFVAGVDLKRQKASTGDRTGAYAESNKASYGLFMEETLAWNDRLTSVIGFRYDRARFDEAITFPDFTGILHFEGWTPKIGIHYKAHPQLNLYATYSQPFKAPNVDDFSAFIPGGSYVGNINIVEQQGDEYEIGLNWKSGRAGDVHLALFHKRIEDEILFNALVFQNQNFDTERSGIEIEHLLPNIVPKMSVRWQYTFTEAEFRKGLYDGNSLPNTPEHSFSLHASYAWLPSLSTWLNWHLIHDGFRINDFSNSLPIDNYGVLDGGLQFNHEPLTLYFTIENLTNEEYTSFQSSNGITISTGENPAPPRTYLLGLRTRF